MAYIIRRVVVWFGGSRATAGPSDVHGWLAKWDDYIGQCYEQEKAIIQPKEQQPTSDQVQKIPIQPREQQGANDQDEQEKAIAKGKERVAALMLARRDRNIQLHGLATSPSRPPRRVVSYLWNALREHDELVDTLLLGESTEGLRASNEQLIAQLKELRGIASARVEEVQRAYARWRRWATGAAIGGVLAVVVGQVAWLFGYRFGADDPLVVWGLLGLTLIGLGLACATIFTRTAAGDLGDGWRLVLTVLPILMVIVAVAGIVAVAAAGAGAGAGPFSRDELRTAYIGTGVVAALAAVAVLAAGAISSNPERALDDTARTLFPVPVAGRAHADRVDQLEAELRTAEAVVEERSRQERRSARRWLSTHILVGGLGALASAAAGVVLNAEPSQQVLSQQTRSLVTLLALVGAGLTALATTLNPGRRWETAAVTAGSCEALAREIGVMTRLDLDEELEPESGPRHGREALEDVLSRYDSIVGVPGRDSFWSRLKGDSTSRAGGRRSRRRGGRGRSRGS